MTNMPAAGFADVAYGLEKSVLCVADSAGARRNGAELIVAAGARPLTHAPLEDGAPFDRGVADAVLVDLSVDGGAALDALLDEVQACAADGRLRGVVRFGRDLMDVVAARIDHPDLVLMCAPTDMECVAEIGLTLASLGDPQVREQDDSPELRRLSEEVSRIARALASLSGAEPVPMSRAIVPPEHPADMPGAATVRAALRARRLREQFFEPDLFADPAWDMLLDLLLARLERRSVAVSSLCIAASVPPTTALRWIKRLTDEGIFIRTADPRDGRRIFIDLADQASHAMAAYFRALDRNGIAAG